MSNTTASLWDDAATEMPVGFDGAGDGWLKAFTLCSIFSASLSIVGSSLILRRIIIQSRVRSRHCNSSCLRSLLSCAPYTHLMLGLSTSDIFASLVYTTFNVLDPTETSSFSWAIGNQGTCDAAGFLSQLSLTPLFYNAMLSLYYMLTIRFAVTEKTFAKCWEPWLHLIVLGFPSSTGIYLLVQGYYDDVDNALSCWVTDGDLAWIFVGAPVCLIFVCIVVNNLIIYCFVRRTIRQSARDHHAPGQNDIQQVATMAFLYVGTFLISCMWAFMTSVLEFYTDLDGSTTPRIAFRLLYHIFHPLQGFWNLLVFCRPRYLKYRKHMIQMQQRQEQQQQTLGTDQNSSDGMTTIMNNQSSDFSYQDETEQPAYDTSIQGALVWATIGPEALPNGTRTTSNCKIPDPSANNSRPSSMASRNVRLFGQSFEFWKGRSSMASSTKEEELLDVTESKVMAITEESPSLMQPQIEDDPPKVLSTSEDGSVFHDNDTADVAVSKEAQPVVSSVVTAEEGLPPC